ncbi:MAG TPA: type II toxin-antitoxin system RelE/ParE family toxin [Lacipirellulaceae bacterium]|jgi:plasmid stabilization system protein ParE
MNDFVFLNSARSEYNSAVDWYSSQSVRAAERFADEVESAIQSIIKNPEQHPRWNDQHRYYLLNDFPYFVGYRYLLDEILIVAVRHTSRDQDAWTDR